MYNWKSNPIKIRIKIEKKSKIYLGEKRYNVGWRIWWERSWKCDLRNGGISWKLWWLWLRRLREL